MIKVIIFDFWGVVFNPMTGETQEGLESFLQEIQSRNLKCGIASSSSRQFITDFLEPRNLQDYFEVIVSIDDVANTKPDPECYLKVAEQFGVSPEECVIIDDSLPPVTMAKQQGFQTILFGTDTQTFAEIDLSS